MFSIFPNRYLHQMWPRPFFRCAQIKLLVLGEFPSNHTALRVGHDSTAPLEFVELCSENVALDVFVSRPMCVSLGFLWGEIWVPRPLEYMALPVDHTWLEVIYMITGMKDSARAFWRTSWSSSSLRCSRCSAWREFRVLVSSKLRRGRCVVSGLWNGGGGERRLF